MLAHTNYSYYSIILELFARQHGLSILEVERDGNCLFSPLAYQLQAIGYDVNVSSIRQMVASYLSDHSDFHSSFVHQAVTSNDGYNTDNEASDEEHTYIQSLSDPKVQQQLR